MLYQVGVAPELSIAYRFVMAAAIMIAFCVATRRKLMLPRPRLRPDDAARPVPVLHQLHPVLLRRRLHDDRPARGGVFHDHRAQHGEWRDPVRAEDRRPRRDRRRLRPGRARADLLVGHRRARDQSSHPDRPRPVAARHAQRLVRQHGVDRPRQARRRRGRIQHHQHEHRRGGVLRVRDAAWRAARLQSGAELHHLAAVPGAVRDGDRVRRVPDAGAPHRRRARRLFLGAVPDPGAGPERLVRGLPAAARGDPRRRPDPDRQRVRACAAPRAPPPATAE